MDMNGNIVTYNRVGRLLALLWIVVAAFAMQLVASAQVISSRFSTEQSAGNRSLPEGGATDTTLSRHAIRALPADMRFLADRGESKFASGGPEPFFTVASIDAAAFASCAVALRELSNEAVDGVAANLAWPRGPPAFQA